MSISNLLVDNGLTIYCGTLDAGSVVLPGGALPDSSILVTRSALDTFTANAIMLGNGTSVVKDSEVTISSNVVNVPISDPSNRGYYINALPALWRDGTDTTYKCSVDKVIARTHVAVRENGGNSVNITTATVPGAVYTANLQVKNQTIAALDDIPFFKFSTDAVAGTASTGADVFLAMTYFNGASQTISKMAAYVEIDAATTGLLRLVDENSGLVVAQIEQVAGGFTSYTTLTISNLPVGATLLSLYWNRTAGAGNCLVYAVDVYR